MEILCAQKQVAGRNDTFEKRGFKLVGIFDVSDSVVGGVIHGIQVDHMDRLEWFLERNHVDIAIIAIPKSAVEETVDRLIKGGIKGILNFSELSTYPNK